MSIPAIEFRNVKKWYGDHQVLNDVNQSITKGRTIVLCGASGSGKSTLIRTVNRLEPVQGGQVLVNGIDIAGKNVDINGLREKIGFVFQSLNLFPHLDALDNVAMPLLRVKKIGARAARMKATALLERVGLSHRISAMPADLSGGEEQRVAIARTLALEPEFILFDEPTSALDPERVGEVLDLIQSLSGDGRTIMCVTHEMNFARKVADEIWFLENGMIVETAEPETFFDNPQHPSLKTFLSKMPR